MAVRLELRAAPNVNENDFSIEQFLAALTIANPLGQAYQTPIAQAVGFVNFFGPPSGTYTYAVIIPPANYTASYKLMGPSTDQGVTVTGTTIFPCTGVGGASPSFGLFINQVSTTGIWTFMFL